MLECLVYDKSDELAKTTLRYYRVSDDPDELWPLCPRHASDMGGVLEADRSKWPHDVPRECECGLHNDCDDRCGERGLRAGRSSC